MAPALLDHPKVGELFSAAAVARARETLLKVPGGLGAYSDSRGALGIRQEVANYIAHRDGLATPPNPDHVFLTDGASVGVRSCMNALIRDSRDGVLVPIPQYPLYSASIALYGGSLVPYSLNEKAGWSLDVEGMKTAVATAKAKGVTARALVFINPGNPTGQCLSEENLAALCRFAYENKIVLMADEVYQENVYQDARPFVSARKVLKSLGEPYASGVELLSFHTVSKGSLGECGMRGGYFEMHNIAQGTVDELYKVASINLSPNIAGQVMMSLMVNPPPLGTPARAAQDAEKAAILASLRRRAHMMTDGFNSLEGVTCNFTEGAMYSFPRLHLPPKAIAAAKAAGKAPDVFYCLRLVEATGIRLQGSSCASVAGQRLRPGGGHVPPADNHPAAGAEDEGGCGAAAHLPRVVHGGISVKSGSGEAAAL
jgi:glutamate--glyoxylate aminotransferase